MIARKLGWLLLELLLCLLAFLYGSSVALALAVLLILLPLGTLPVNLYLKHKITTQLEAAASQRKGAEAAITIHLENPTLFPILRLRCDLMIQNQLNRECRTQPVETFVLPRKKQSCTLLFESRYSGRLRLSVSQVVLYDCFGLIGVSCQGNSVAHMTVLPETFEPVVRLSTDAGSTDDSESYSQERPGGDLTETFQIREYVPGDSIRQIHWKLASKFDRLIVRDPGLPISKDVLVFWERTGGNRNPDRIDAQAEVVVSLCRSLIDCGIQFTVGWNDPERNQCVLHRISNMDEFVGVTPRILRASGAESGISGAGLLLQTRPEALCAHMVYLAEQPGSEVLDLQHYGRVTMLLCGEPTMDGAIYFNEADYLQQLTEIEI